MSIRKIWEKIKGFFTNPKSLTEEEIDKRVEELFTNTTLDRLKYQLYGVLKAKFIKEYSELPESEKESDYAKFLEGIIDLMWASTSHTVYNLHEKFHKFLTEVGMSHLQMTFYSFKMSRVGFEDKSVGINDFRPDYKSLVTLLKVVEETEL